MVWLAFPSHHISRLDAAKTIRIIHPFDQGGEQLLVAFAVLGFLQYIFTCYRELFYHSVAVTPGNPPNPPFAKGGTDGCIAQARRDL